MTRTSYKSKYGKSQQLIQDTKANENNEYQDAQISIIVPSVNTAFVTYTEFIQMQKHGLEEETFKKYYMNYFNQFMEERISKYVNLHLKENWFKDTYEPEQQQLQLIQHINLQKKLIEKMIQENTIEKITLDFSNINIQLDNAKQVSTVFNNVQQLQGIQLESILGSQLAQIVGTEMILIENISPIVSNLQLIECLSEIQELKAYHVNIPNPQNNFFRSAYCLLDPQSNTNEVLQKLNEKEIMGMKLQCLQRPIRAYGAEVKTYANIKEITQDYCHLLEVLKLFVETNGIQEELLTYIQDQPSFLKKFDALLYTLYNILGYNAFQNNFTLNKIKQQNSIQVLLYSINFNISEHQQELETLSQFSIPDSNLISQIKNHLIDIYQPNTRYIEWLQQTRLQRMMELMGYPDKDKNYFYCKRCIIKKSDSYFTNEDDLKTHVIQQHEHLFPLIMDNYIIQFICHKINQAKYCQIYGSYSAKKLSFEQRDPESEFNTIRLLRKGQVQENFVRLDIDYLRIQINKLTIIFKYNYLQPKILLKVLIANLFEY